MNPGNRGVRGGGTHFEGCEVEVFDQDPTPLQHRLCEGARAPHKLARGLGARVGSDEGLGVHAVVQVDPDQRVELPAPETGLIYYRLIICYEFL